MHMINGLSIRFTSRTSWMADVFKGSKLVATVPVAWRDQIVFDPVLNRPVEFLVWLRTKEKALAWRERPEGIIAIAEAVDRGEQPRRFKEFLRLYRVAPFEMSENPLAVRAAYVEVITVSSFD